MLISREPPFVFVHIPKTGRTSIVKALTLAMAHPPLDSDKGYTHATAIDLRDKKVGKVFWKKAVSFAVVRNPWAHRVSCWMELNKKEELAQKMRDLFTDFEGWLHWIQKTSPDFLSSTLDIPVSYKRYACLPQTDYLTDPEGALIVNYILRFEDLEAGFNTLCQATGIPHTPLPRLNVSRHTRRLRNTPDFKDWYTPKTWKMISEIYQQDVKRFGYDKG